MPATGKTRIAQELSVERRAAYVRIDTIETAIDNAEGRFGQTNKWHVPPGYLVGYDVAATGFATAWTSPRSQSIHFR